MKVDIFNNSNNKIERTTAEDFPICDSAQNVIKNFEGILTPEDLFFLEDCLRGLSQKMQIVILYRVFVLMTEDRRISTGVKHVDNMIRQIYRLFDKEFLEFVREHYKWLEGKKSLGPSEEDFAN